MVEPSRKTKSVFKKRMAFYKKLEEKKEVESNEEPPVHVF